MGFVSIINLRESSETGAEVERKKAWRRPGLAPRAVQRPIARPQGRRPVPRRDYVAGGRARVHSLRRRQSRRDDVVDQAARGGWPGMSIEPRRRPLRSARRVRPCGVCPSTTPSRTSGNLDVYPYDSTVIRFRGTSSDCSRLNIVSRNRGGGVVPAAAQARRSQTVMAGPHE